MAIDKNYWTNITFIKGKFPVLLCPTCCKGQLKANKDSFKFEETGDSKKYFSEPWWDFTMTKYRFTLLLKCTNDQCSDITVCIGLGKLEDYPEYDEMDQQIGVNYKQVYEPIYFIPTPHIIPILDNYPKDLRQQLVNSFSHFFSDLTSCANKIRICVEVLMDNLKIKKTEIKSGKRQNIQLHTRIMDYKKKNSEIADYLLAIKWIGNSGSHFDNLTKDDILEAYTLLEFSLDKIYNGQEKIVKKLSKEINKKKAPLSKRNKKKRA